MSTTSTTEQQSQLTGQIGRESNATKFWPTYFLALFLGIFAAHRFYNRSPHRVLMLLTLGGFGLWTFIDLLTILLGKFKDEHGIAIPNAKPSVSWAIFVVSAVIGMASGGSEPRADNSNRPAAPSANSGVSRTSGAADVERQVWEILTDKSEFAGSPLVGSLRVQVRVAFFSESGMKCFMYKGAVGSTTIDLIGRDGMVERNQSEFKIRFNVFKASDGSFTEMGTATVSGSMANGEIKSLHYTESFTQAAGMEFELRR
jgi:hypothetical protein